MVYRFSDDTTCAFSQTVLRILNVYPSLLYSPDELNMLPYPTNPEITYITYLHKSLTEAKTSMLDFVSSLFAELHLDKHGPVSHYIDSLLKMLHHFKYRLFTRPSVITLF
ncbi:hypothetical protein Mapa_007371 [Marchantia paleacea]|nr:hypothetical protein Mapa_007371 [Marchantia paleacea]